MLDNKTSLMRKEILRRLTILKILLKNRNNIFISNLLLSNWNEVATYLTIEELNIPEDCQIKNIIGCLFKDDIYGDIYKNGFWIAGLKAKKEHYMTKEETKETIKMLKELNGNKLQISAVPFSPREYEIEGDLYIEDIILPANLRIEITRYPGEDSEICEGKLIGDSESIFPGWLRCNYLKKKYK